MAAELLTALLRANLALAAAVLVVLILRRPVRRMFGARAAYALWAVAPLAAIAVLLPARTVLVSPHPSSAPAVVAAPAHAATSVATTIQVPPAPPPRLRLETFERPLLVLWALVAALALLVQAERQRRFVRGLGKLRSDGGVFHAERPGAGPAVIGALFPRLVLPADFALRFTADEQGLILAHERHHLACGDARINALAATLQALCWFNPLAHLGARQLRIDQEIACDAAVLARFPTAGRLYGEALLKTQLAAHAPPLGCAWPATAKSQLKERFVMLDHHRKSRALRRIGGGAVAVLAVGASLAAWAAQPARVVHDVRRVTVHDQMRDLASPLFKAVREGDVAGAKALIAAGADVDFKAKGDGTPLIEAARAGRADLAELLLKGGADPNLASPGDGAPLLAAAAGGQKDVVQTLVEHGANLDLAVPTDGTPLINAIRSGDSATVAYLVGKGADVNQLAPRDGTPLIEAARTGRLDLVTLLLAKGARAGQALAGEGDPLIAAAGGGHLEIVKAVAHGASVESFVYGDETPLINAAQSGDLPTVRYLVEQGADVSRAVPANRGQTRSPLGEAVKHGHDAIAAYLRAKGARA